MKLGDRKLPEHFKQLASSKSSFWLTDEEIRHLILLRVYAGPEPVTTEHIVEVLNWAESVRISNGMLEAVISGGALPHGCSTPGDFRTMRLTMTAKGEAEAKEIEQRLKKEHPGRSKR